VGVGRLDIPSDQVIIGAGRGDRRGIQRWSSWDRYDDALVYVCSFVAEKEVHKIFPNRAADSSAELVPFQRVSSGREKISRIDGIISQELKRIAMARAEESQDPESAAAFTGLEVDGLKKMLANKVKREKKKAEKAKNKTLPPKDQVVELLTALNEKLDLICRVVLGPSAQAVPSAPVPQGDLLLDFHTSLATTDSSVTVQGDETGRADIEPLSLS